MFTSARLLSLQIFFGRYYSAVWIDSRKFIQQEMSLFRSSEIRSGFGQPEQVAKILMWSVCITTKALAAIMAKVELVNLQGQPCSRASMC